LVSLYGSLEHLLSDAKSIKESLIQIANYIDNKQIDSSKANDVTDLKGIGEAFWKLISSIYSSGWCCGNH